jgi:hypothetical protein
MLQVVYEKCLADDSFLRKVVLGREIEKVFLEKDIDKSLEELSSLRQGIASFFSCNDIDDFIRRIEQDEALMNHVMEYSRESIAFILSWHLTSGLASVVWVS